MTALWHAVLVQEQTCDGGTSRTDTSSLCRAMEMAGKSGLVGFTSLNATPQELCSDGRSGLDSREYL